MSDVVLPNTNVRSSGMPVDTDTETGLVQVWVNDNGTLALLDTAHFVGGPTTTLTSRMLAKAPATGYELWMDTADTSFIYLLEAASGTTDQDSLSWRGIRLPLDADGNVVGAIRERSTLFAWNSRTVGW